MATKDTLLLQPGSRTADVAATFTSHATGQRGQHIVDIFAMDVDDNCKDVENEMSISDKRKHRWRPARTNNDRDNDFDHLESALGREETIRSYSCTLKMTTDDDVSNVSAWTFVLP